MTDSTSTFDDDPSGDLRCPNCHELVNPAAVEVDGDTLRCPVCGASAHYAGTLDLTDLGVQPQ
jgi:ssDNA-binding Zn-finger/Zn-ribbon topoisomerase 1